MGYRGILLLSWLFAGSASAATINVPADQLTIQAAINAANNGDTVLVAPGTYYEKLNFKGKAITVTSSGGAGVTILDGKNSGPIVTFDTSEGNNSVLQGFTLTHANWNNFGAAVYIVGAASPMILDNTFSYNTASPGYWGSAIGGDGLGSPVILRNYFTHNICNVLYFGGSVVGFGYAGSPVVADNVFVNNPCAAIYVLLRYSASPKIYNNTIVGNQDGIDLQLFTINAGTVFSNNLIAYNQHGLISGSSPTLPWTNNLVYGNTAADYGGISNQTGIAGNISADPRLKFWVSGDVHLLSHSPAIDAGDSTVSQDSVTDYYGNSRVNAAVVDIGAVESVMPDDMPGVAPIINVPGDEPTIQDAIDAASDGDVVLVAPGTYYEKLDFKGKAITVKGAGAADTILDGQGGGPIVTIDAGEGYGSVLQGFTLADAKPVTAVIGSAVYLAGSSSPQIIDNVFVDNAEYDGLWGAAIGGNNGSAIIVGNLFKNNACSDGVVSFKNESSPSIVNNVFLNNGAGSEGCAAISIALSGGTPYVSNNSIVNNPVGIHVQAAAGASLQTYRNNLLYKNFVGLEVDDVGSPGGYPAWKNNLVYGNTTANYQGIADQTGTNDNLSADPEFADIADGSVKLTYGSPAIDVGDMSAPTLPITDFYGDPEPFAGIPEGIATVDIGASEYHPPIVTAKGDGVAVTVNTPANSTLASAGADPSEPLIYALVTQALHGTATITNTATGVFQYVPAAGYSGPDSFTFDVTDPYGTVSDPATEIVNVGDVAAISHDGSAITQVDVAVSGSLSATPTDGEQVLRFAVVSQPAHGNLTVDPVTGKFTYIPSTGFAGLDSFSFEATDQYELASNIATVQITVNDIAPTTSGGALSLSAGNSNSAILSATTAYAGQALTYSVVSQPAHGNVTLTATTGHFVYTPNAGYAGSDSFTFQVTDAYGTSSNAATEQVTVNDIAPVALSNVFIMNPDVVATGTLGVILGYSDQTVSYSVVAQPSHGTASVDPDTGQYTYTPATGFTGQDTFTFDVTDSYGLTSATAPINVIVADSAPRAADGSVGTTPGTATDGTLSGTTAYAGQILTFSVISLSTHGNVTITDAATGAFHYVPAQGYIGPDAFAFKVSDQYGLVAGTATEQITVADTAPTAGDGSVSTSPDISMAGVLSATQAYVGQTLTFGLVSLPTHGTVNLNTASGKFTYTPANGYFGPDTFTFDVIDQYGTASNTARESVSVIDNAPTTNGGNVSTAPDTAVSGTLSATLGYVGQILTFSVVSQPAHGSVSLDASTGKFTYTPAKGFASTDSFSFQATDAYGNSSNIATVNVTVTDIAPKANGGILKLRPHTSSYNGVLKATAAYSGQTLTYRLVGTPAAATLTDPSTGAFSLSASSGINNKDSFSFQVVDQWGTVSNTATITILVL